MAEQRNNDFQESRTERETQKLAEAISRSLMMAEKAIASNQRSENASGTGMGGKDSVELVYLVLSKFKYILLSAVLCAVLVGTYVFFIMDPVYAATAKLYIMGQDSSSILADLQIGSYLTKDYQEVFQTWEVHEMVREELNLPYTYKDMQEMLTVTNPSDTRVLYITVKTQTLTWLRRWQIPMPRPRRNSLSKQWIPRNPALSLWHWFPARLQASAGQAMLRSACWWELRWQFW